MQKLKLKNNKKEKVIVTGGAGFIGSHIVDALIEEGFEVHIIDNLSNGKEENINKKAIFHKLDICHLEEISPVFEGVKYVFHEAALPRVQFSIENPIESNNANVMGTLNVLVASKDSGVKRVVYAASSSAYGDQSVMPLVETMKANPKSPYGLQKYIGELYMNLFHQIYGIETVSLRYFNVYGPRLNPDGAYALVVGRFLKQVKSGDFMTITGDGTQTRDFTHVRDVVRANLLAMKSEKVGKGDVLNIGAGLNYSINDVAKLIGGKIKYVDPRLEPHDTLASNKKAFELLGWKPKEDLSKGIKELKKIWGIK